MIGLPEATTRRERVLALAGLCVAALVVSGCAHQPRPDVPGLPGFFAGVRDGFLIFFSLVGSLFTDVRIYAFPNSGGWYDLGYFIGAAAFLGGGVCGTTTRGATKVVSAE